MEPVVVIKHECDEGDDDTVADSTAYTTMTTAITFLPDQLDIKQEEPIHIKDEVDCNSNNNHNLLSPTHTTSTSDAPAYNAETFLPDQLDIKQEEPIHIKDEIDCISNNNHNLLAPTHTTSTSDAPAYNAETLSMPEFAESFVVYELEPVPANVPDATPTTMATPVYCQPATTPPPILLNAKLRKRPRVDNITSPIVSTAPQCKAVSDTLVVNAPKRAPENAIGELKVKCFCRLSNHSGGTSTEDSLELKHFFEEMFNETRQLTRAQQRVVEMVLLEAVCQAEEDVEACRCCEKCCT